MTKKRTIVTAALPYVNNVPHLGNIIPTLSADVYHRFLKLAGHESIYICGTDEHGTRTEIESAQRNQNPDEYCRELHAQILKLYNWLGIEFDNFGRTSSRENHKLTQEIFLNLYKNNYIFEDTITQLYCKNCERYLPDTYVEGECPHCESMDAKGDKCDECLKVLEPEELVNPKCKICGSAPEVRETKHLFLDLPKLSPQLEDWINSTDWTGIIKNLPLAWIKEGLKPRCITRDLKWGIPAPFPGSEGKSVYVWFEAVLGYVSATKQWAEQNKKPEYWKDFWFSKDTKTVFFIGKDNIPFHLLIFPALLLATKLDYVLPYNVSSTEFLQYNGQKFSKSHNIGIWIDEALELFVDKKAQSVVSMTPCEHSPMWSNTLPKDLSMGSFIRQDSLKRSQDLEQFYRLNGALYVFDAKCLKISGKISYTERSFAYLMSNEKSIDIDTKLDFLIAERIIECLWDNE